MAKDKNRFSNSINIKNRKASYEFEFLDKCTAGLQLQGTEIKSIREGKVQLQDAYCYFKNGELYIKQMHIAQFSEGSYNNHVTDRERKLLLTKRELAKWESKLEEKGLSIVPVRMFISDRGFAKLEVALGKGKKLFDKRDSIKDKDIKRDLERVKY